MAWMENTGNTMVIIFRDRENTESREVYVQKHEAKAAAHGPEQQEQDRRPGSPEDESLHGRAPQTGLVRNRGADCDPPHVTNQTGTLEDLRHVDRGQGEQASRAPGTSHPRKRQPDQTVDFKIPEIVADEVGSLLGLHGRGFPFEYQTLQYRLDQDPQEGMTASRPPSRLAVVAAVEEIKVVSP